MRALALATTVLLGSLIAASSAEGQACSVIAFPACGLGAGNHSSTGGGTDGCADHNSACYTCYQGGQQVSFAKCHNCGFFQEGEEGEQYEELLAALEGSDVALIVRLASRVPSRVIVNRTRAALQIASCDGEHLVAHVPLRRREIAALERQLQLARSDGDVAAHGKAMQF